MAVTASKLQLYGLGIVAGNKLLDKKTIEVTPIEDVNFVDGEITDNLNTENATGVDASGNTYSASVQSAVSVQATWLPIGITNRATAPDVRRGEKVVLYQFGDADAYWWTTLEYDMRLRKLETVIYAFSATQDEAADGTGDTTYYFEVSTHKKLVSFHTSKANGEPFAYDIQINTQDGNILIQDDIGNIISLDSKNVRLELINSEGSHIDMDRQNIIITAPDSITLNAGNDILLNAGKTIASKSGDSITDETGEITTQASSTTNTVPTTTFSGNVTIGGATTTKSFSSTGTAGGEFVVSGPGTFTDAVHVASLTSAGPVTAPNID